MTNVKLIFRAGQTDPTDPADPQGSAGEGGGRGTGKAYPPRGWVRGIVNKKVVNLLRKTADGLSFINVSLIDDSQSATFLCYVRIAVIYSQRQSAVR